MADPSGRRILVARIGAPHGIRGEVRLWSFTADPAAVKRYEPFESLDGRQRFELETMRPAKDCFVARFRGVADRDAAERLRNVDLYVPRDRLPIPEDPGEYYLADLIGLAVQDRSGTRIGSVGAVQNFGAGDLLEITPAGGGDSLLIAFTQASVPTVDIAAGTIVVDLPQERD